MGTIVLERLDRRNVKGGNRKVKSVEAKVMDGFFNVNEHRCWLLGGMFREETTPVRYRPTTYSVPTRK